jgi:hypothetical protein
VTRVEHVGFSGRAGAAAAMYLDKRGVVRLGAPNIVPEFENPLFLKTCCDYLEKEGKNELPRGLRSVTKIFAFYMEAVTRGLTPRMGLDHHQEIIPRAINGLATMFTTRGIGYVPKLEAIALFESIHASHGQLRQSLLAQLENEGVIVVEPVLMDDTSRGEVVRFTFERFSDHVIATHLLDTHLDVSRPVESFGRETKLYDVVGGTKSYAYAGVIEAIAIQLPERTDCELLDVIESPDLTLGARLTVENAFLASVLWRDQSRFTRRTFDLVAALRDADYLVRLLVAVSTEPDNKFNARFLDKRLRAWAMSERDQNWSTCVAVEDSDEGGSIETLITWAFHHGAEALDDVRAELAAITLSWLLSTSNRSIRDRATKALVCVLAPRLDLAVRLIHQFHDVDDFYVFERILGAVYGAVLQGVAVNGHQKLAEAVYEVIFASGIPPLNVLARDHAQRILTYLQWTGLLPASLDKEKCVPPYRSPWPIEFVPDEIIESYKENYGKGEFSDRIVHSSVGMMGDYARYVIDRVVGHWRPAPIGTAVAPTSKDVLQRWLTEFEIWSTDTQKAALKAVFEAAVGVQGQPDWQDSSTRRIYQAAEAAFRFAIPEERWEE